MRAAFAGTWQASAGLRALTLLLAASALGLTGQVRAQAEVAATATARAAAPLPAELFYRQPDIQDARLSPSGRWLALTTQVSKGRTGLVVIDLQTGKPMSAPANYSDGDVDDFFWVNDDRLVYDLTDRQRGGGDQRWWPGLYSVSRDGSDFRLLVNGSGTSVNDSRVRESQRPLDHHHTLLHVPAGNGQEVIVGKQVLNGSYEVEAVVPLRVNVITGRARSMNTDAPGGVVDWLFSPEGEPRVAIARRGARSAVYWRGPGEDRWRQLYDGDRYEQPFQPRHVDSRSQLYVTQALASGDIVLKRFDFERGEPEAEPMVSTPGFDFRGYLVTESRGARALGVRVELDAETTHWFDARLKALQAEAERRLPGRVVRLSCRRCEADDMTVLVRAYSDRDPGQLWVHTLADGQWRKVGEVRLGVDARRMASTDFERVPTRDGHRMPLWITRPPQVAGPLPTVVLVHGGPWVRGRTWGWDADAQFLASRGYLVLEPEFRGSRGYGYDWYRAGWKQWGRAMQDDVADALAWAVKAGQADPQRVCIAGASYGGYATLMGLVRHPELYRCGVAWVAVTDPRLMFQWRYGTDQADSVREVDYPRLIGDPVADAAMIDSVSPVLQASRIRSPVFLAFGREDRRVLPVHGQRMRQALIDEGRPPEWVEYSDEGHGWYKLENQLDFAARLEAFLARHLKP